MTRPRLVRMLRDVAAAALSLSLLAGGARADAPSADVDGAAAEPTPPPAMYLASLVSTTLAYRPNGGAFGGPVGDVTPAVGVGRFLSETVAVELDFGVTFDRDGNVALAVTPGVVWAFHPNFYAAARFIIPIDPTPNFVLAPGVGATLTFAGGIAPFIEVNALSAVGRGEPDFGVGISVGATYGF